MPLIGRDGSSDDADVFDFAGFHGASDAEVVEEVVFGVFGEGGRPSGSSDAGFDVGLFGSVGLEAESVEGLVSRGLAGPRCFAATEEAIESDFTGHVTEVGGDADAAIGGVVSTFHVESLAVAKEAQAIGDVGSGGESKEVGEAVATDADERAVFVVLEDKGFLATPFGVAVVAGVLCFAEIDGEFHGGFGEHVDDIPGRLVLDDGDGGEALDDDRGRIDEFADVIEFKEPGGSENIVDLDFVGAGPLVGGRGQAKRDSFFDEAFDAAFEFFLVGVVDANHSILPL